MSGPVALILGREIAVSALREWMALRGKSNSVKVGSLGKIKTTCQMIAIILLMMILPANPVIPTSILTLPNPSTLLFIGVVSLYIATALTLVSGLQYFNAAKDTLYE